MANSLNSEKMPIFTPPFYQELWKSLGPGSSQMNALLDCVAA